MVPLLYIVVSCIFSLSRGASIPGVKTTEKYNQSTLMDTDGNFILFWNFNDTHITFEVHVRTKGWVGFGLSSNGNMYPGDVVVGWVTGHGHTHFSDRHTTGHAMPIKDRSQDWTLLFAEENEFGTVLKFVRLIDTCDTEDEVITEGTIRLIYAYSQDDPASDNSIMYHGTTRGTKSVSLLNSHYVPESMPNNLITFDFFNDNTLMPNDTTTYWCRVFQLPNVGQHHMIKYEAIITPGNELNVHHILIYRCRNGNPAFNGVKGNCLTDPRQKPDCSDIVIAWEIGGGAVYFPENVGFSVGGPDDGSFYFMQTHYDNPTMRTGVIDNSGVRITLTSSLRPIEAGMLEIGQVVNTLQIIPPYQEKFISKGFCDERCVREGFVQSNLTEIKMFGALQHSHFLGVGMKTRHFRNGVELKPLLEDPNYDINFQEFRVLPKEVSIYPGDSFTVECTYDSRGRTGPTFGGLSTLEEMCLTFAYYYPKMKLAHCRSEHLHENYEKPDELYRSVVSRDWKNKTVVADFIEKTDAADVNHDCGGLGFNWPTPAAGSTVFVEKETAHPYAPLPCGILEV